MKIVLYDYQGVALNKVLYALRKFGRALMVMATGLGKTIVSVKIAEFFLSFNPGKRILFLSHDNGILEQSFLKYKSVLGEGYSYARFFGKKKNWKSDKHDIVFATFQSNPHKFFMADHFDLIIVDESHHSKADTYFNVLTYFTRMWNLGMTATPDRQDERDIRAIFGKEVVNYDLPEAMAKGWLTPVEYKVLTDGLDREMLEAICNEVLVENIRITEGQLNERIFIRTRTDEQCKRILEHTDNGLKAIVFCSNITHLNTVMELLPNSVAVHSDRTDDENDEAERMYRSGLVRHILVVDKYNEGKDLPDTDVLVFMRPTDSYRIWIQQLGRGLRLFPGKEKVIVLDFVGNIERIKNVYMLITRIGQFSKNGKSQELKLDSPLHVEGENFIFDFTSEIVNLFSVLERIALPFYETWQEASFASKSLGIKHQRQYPKLYRQDPRLNSTPDRHYKDFPGWAIFFGRPSRIGKVYYETCQEASKAAQALGIRFEPQYREKYKKDPKLNSTPERYYKDFPGWPQFLRNEKPVSSVVLKKEKIVKFPSKEETKIPLRDKEAKMTPTLLEKKHSRWNYPTWQEASLVAITFGITSKREYEENSNLDKKLPSSPHKFYKDFPGWGIFLGTFRTSNVKNKVYYSNVEDASAAAIKIGIRTKDSYFEMYKLDDKLPSSPRHYYKNFPGWPKFLGKK